MLVRTTRFLPEDEEVVYGAQCALDHPFILCHDVRRESVLFDVSLDHIQADRVKELEDGSRIEIPATCRIRTMYYPSAAENISRDTRFREGGLCTVLLRIDRPDDADAAAEILQRYLSGFESFLLTGTLSQEETTQQAPAVVTEGLLDWQIIPFCNQEVSEEPLRNMLKDLYGEDAQPSYELDRGSPVVNHATREETSLFLRDYAKASGLWQDPFPVFHPLSEHDVLLDVSIRSFSDAFLYDNDRVFLPAEVTVNRVFFDPRTDSPQDSPLLGATCPLLIWLTSVLPEENETADILEIHRRYLSAYDSCILSGRIYESVDQLNQSFAKDFLSLNHLHESPPAGSSSPLSAADYPLLVLDGRFGYERWSLIPIDFGRVAIEPMELMIQDLYGRFRAPEYDIRTVYLSGEACRLEGVPAEDAFRFLEQYVRLRRTVSS